MGRMSRKMRNRILIVVLPVLIIVLIVRAAYYYNIMKQSHLERYDESQKIAESHIVETINLIDAGYRMLEIRLETELRLKAEAFLKAYQEANGDINRLDLEQLKKNQGSGYEFVIVDASTTIIRGTIPEAMNFNFTAFDPELGRKITEIRKGNDVWFEELRTNVVNGRLSKFSYIPTPDHKYLLEVAYSADGFNHVTEDLKPQTTINNLLKVNPLIKEIHLFDMYGYRVVDTGENFKPTPESVRNVQRAKNEKVFTLYEGENIVKRYIYIPLNQKRAYTLANTDQVVEIVYDKSAFNKTLKALWINTIIVSLFIIVFFSIGVIYFSRRLTKPIEALKEIADEIAKGNYNVKAEVNFQDEVGELAKSVNSMIAEINNSFSEISAQNALLEDYNKTLEEKVVARTQEIACQNEELQEKNRELEIAWIKANEATESKSNFLAMMSHEIRTPINGVIGMAYLILRTNLTPKQRDYVHKMKSSGENLLEMINGVLDISKLEAGKTHLEHISFQLDEVFELLSNQLGYRAAEKNLELVFACDSNVPNHLMGDPLRLRQILLNLLNNAIKFTDHGEIKIHVQVKENDGSNVCLEFFVQDTGVGIENSKIEGLFEPFQQVDDSTTRKYGGTGLGLSICKRFVELMNGEIHVTSKVGEGSIFTFTARFEHDNEGIELEAGRIELKGLNVLIVDDCETTRDVLLDMLSENFSRVEVAASGHEALEIINRYEDLEEPLDIVLMDWKMPGIDGIETAYQIKQKGYMRHVPAVLMLTGYDLDEAKTHDKSHHIDAFLSKPVIRSSLIQTIEKMLKKTEPDEQTKSLQMLNDKIHQLLLADPTLTVSILLAEDNAINQQIIKELLEQPGIEVDLVDNGLSAVEAVSKKKYDLVLMDIQMPECDGFEATRRIRNLPNQLQVPIVAMTAHALEEDRIKSMASGMNDFMSKPVDEMKLYEMLMKWIDKDLEIVSTDVETVNYNEALLMKLKSFQTKGPLDNLHGNLTLYKRLLSDFYNDFKGAGQQVLHYLETNDLEKARMVVHSVRGIAGNLGAIGLHIVSQVLETDFSKKPVNVTDEGFIAFQEELDRVMEEIELVIRDESSQDMAFESKLLPLGMGELFAELKNLLEQGSSEVELLIPAINKLFAHAELSQLGSELVKHIKNYDFDEALETIDRIESQVI